MIRFYFDTVLLVIASLAAYGSSVYVQSEAVIWLLGWKNEKAMNIG